MIKYIDSRVTFQEVPDEISLCFTITNCQYNCAGCNQPELRDDAGSGLWIHTIKELLSPEVTCVCFLGDGNDIHNLRRLAKSIHRIGLKTALYTGQDKINVDYWNNFDYLKIGAYREGCGPLTSKTTNQIMFNTQTGEDITYKFNKQKELQ